MTDQVMGDAPVSQTPVQDGLVGETNTNGVPGSEAGETREETIKRLYKVTVDGEDLEVDEDELRKGYAHNKAAAKRMEEAANSKKEAAQVIRMFQENPREMFKHFGMNLQEFVAKVFHDDLEESSLTPDQKELRDHRARFAKEQAAQREAEEAQKAEQTQRETEALAQSLQADMIDAIKQVGLPQGHVESLRRMINYMQLAAKQGIELSPADAAPIVKKDYLDDIKALAGSSDTDALRELFGNDVIKKLAKSSIESNPVRTTTVPKSVNADRGTKATEKKQSPRDFFKKR